MISEVFCGEGLIWNLDKFWIFLKCLLDMFLEVCDDIVKYIIKFFEFLKVKGIKIIFMVGGFLEF